MVYLNKQTDSVLSVQGIVSAQLLSNGGLGSGPSLKMGWGGGLSLRKNSAAEVILSFSSNFNAHEKG